MSEFLAEARILVRPDTTKFRAELEASLAASLKPITIPVIPVVGKGLAAGTAEINTLTGATGEAAVATQALAAAEEKAAVAAVTATAAEAAQARTLGLVARGAGASTLALFGLRGATLAASAPFLIGTAAVVGFAKAVQSAASLQTELNVFKVTAGATADELARVSEEAKQLGRDLTLPGVTASDAATAMTELAKAGLSVRDAMAAARGTLQLATAAQIDNGAAAKLVSAALNSFQLDGTQAVKVADLFAGAAKSAQGSIQDFGPALAQASAVAHAFGISIGDTVTLLTQLAKAGLEGGRAGTSLRVALLRLVNPPAEAAKALKDLNIQIRDANGNLRPQVFTDIEKALQGVSKAQRQATEATIFGSDAVRTQIILGQQGAAAFDQISKAVNESGLAQQQASARTKGLQGDFSNLSNQVQSLGLTFGQVATGPLSVFVKALAGTVSEMALVADGAVSLGSALKNLGKSVPGSSILGPFAGLLQKAAEASNPLTLQLKLAAAAAHQFGVDAQGAGTKLSVFDAIAKSVTDTTNSLADALNRAAAQVKSTQSIPTDSKLGVKQIENVIGGFDAKAVKAKIAGNNAQLVEVLKEEQAFLQAQLQRQFVKNRPALQRDINNALLGVVTDLRSIDAQAKSQNDSLKAAAQRVADQRKRAIEEAAKKIRDAQAAAAKAAADAAQHQKDVQAALEQSLQLDVSFAQTKDNQSGEISAREALIKQLKKEQALVKRGTVEWKTLRNEIADQVAAIEDLNKEKKKQAAAVKAGQSFAQASFDFLQAQQGFAANLLGNLIPGSATGGLVGGPTSPVEAALTPVAGAADAGSKAGPTAGQQNTANHILDRILQQLKILNGDNVAPEANRQKAGQRAVMDGVGGG